MNIIRVKPLESWKSAAGLCLICGMPLGLTPSSKLSKEGFDQEYDDTMFKPSTDDYEEDEDMDKNKSALEENFVRVSLFKYNLLGKMEACHIIDQYTFLKTNTFKKALLENKKVIEAIGGANLLGGDNDNVFDKAADYCQRVAAKRVIPGCSICNAAMNRANTHADIVYRCFGPTAEINLPELEDSTSKTNRVISKGIVVKKLIQQVALYFTPVKQMDSLILWENREESDIMLHAALWRCIANLAIWGKGGGAVRFGLIAIFYGAVYIFERLKMADLLSFTDWHVHVFRNFYMATYTSATWFGMTQHEASTKFDTTKKNGLKWCELVKEMYLDSACDAVDAFFRSESFSHVKIDHFKNILLLHVHDERTLFIFLSRKCGASKGIHTLMKFFMYNFENPRSILLLSRAQAFMQDIKKPITKELLKHIRLQPAETRVNLFAVEREVADDEHGIHSLEKSF